MFDSSGCLLVQRSHRWVLNRSKGTYQHVFTQSCYRYQCDSQDREEDGMYISVGFSPTTECTRYPPKVESCSRLIEVVGTYDSWSFCRKVTTVPLILSDQRSGDSRLISSVGSYTWGPQRKIFGFMGPYKWYLLVLQVRLWHSPCSPLPYTLHM